MPVTPVQVEAPGTRVQLNDDSVRDGGIDDFAEVQLVPFPPEQQPAGDMTQHGGEGMLDRPDQAARHLLLALGERAVHRSHHIIDLPKRVVIKIQAAIRQDVALRARKYMGAKPPGRIQKTDLLDLAQQPFLRQTIGLETRLGVIRNAEILPPERLRGRRHLSQRIPAIAGGRMIMKRPAQIRLLHQPGQIGALRPLDFPHAFPQLRRDKAQSERGEQVRFRHHSGSTRGSDLFLDRALALRRYEAPLTEAQASGQRALPHLHVVGFRSREVMQGKNKLVLRHEAQVRLQTAGKAHAGLGFTAGRHFLHARLRTEPVDHRSHLARGDNKIQIADRFQPAPQAAGVFRPHDIRESPQTRKNLRGHLVRIPPQVPTPVGLAIGNTLQQFLLGLLPKARQLRHLAGPAGLGQGRDARDSQLTMECPDLLRPEAGNLQQLHQSGLDRRLQLLKKHQFAGRAQLGDLLRQRLANPLHALQAFVRDQTIEFTLLDRFERAGSGGVGPDLERILSL